MKLSHRIFVGYFLVVAIAGIFLLISIKDELRPAAHRSMEETLIDTANLLAEIVARDIRDYNFEPSNFIEAMDAYIKRNPDALIWGLRKNYTSFHIYITDANGIVLYDSFNSENEGKDYSRWNDVYLTLQGKYGARSTRARPDDPSTSTMYVAAPIYYQGEIAGVLTVGKTALSILPLIELSQRNIAQAGIALLIMALAIAWVFSKYISRSTYRLAEYANAVSHGKKAKLPVVKDRELSELAKAMESMRINLEGKEYVENYVHTLTHEIKSPLSGIKGASELLSEDMDKYDQKHFIENIRGDVARIQTIIDKLLELAKLEQQQELDNFEDINLANLINEITGSFKSQLINKSLEFKVDIADGHNISGDMFLIKQAITNIIDNAISFAPESSKIEISGQIISDSYHLMIKDQGAGIPDYAKNKIFDRFYSLPRPGTDKKSSGLGLSLVREVMSLHGGDISVESSENCCIFSLIFPY